MYHDLFKVFMDFLSHKNGSVGKLFHITLVISFSRNRVTRVLNTWKLFKTSCIRSLIRDCSQKIGESLGEDPVVAHIEHRIPYRTAIVIR